MSFLWFLAGGAVVAFYVWFKNTQKAMQAKANGEVVQFIQAIQRWIAAEPKNEEVFVLAVHHVAVYLQRRNDLLADPTGRSLPAYRAVMAQGWRKALSAAGLLTPEGKRPTWEEDAAEFWDAVDWFADAAVREALKERLSS